MCVIICNIQMFTNDQTLYVFDTNKHENVYAQKINLNNLPEAVCTLATQYGIEDVKLQGDVAFNNLWAEEIKATNALNYNIGNLKVEVI